MTTIVYFESITGGQAEQVAMFKDDELYMQCKPALKEMASSQGKTLWVGVEMETMHEYHESFFE